MNEMIPSRYDGAAMFDKRLPTIEDVKDLRKKWYSLLAEKYEEADMRFMNYGFVCEDNDGRMTEVNLDPQEEKYRYPIQLYHYLVRGIQLEGKNVLEVGCGRGGGASYITGHLGPKSYTGIDLAQSAIRLCRKRNAFPQLTFLVGDAENLPFREGLFDVVMNVESSHCYHPIEKFLASVRRVLVSGGFLLLTDFRSLMGLDELRRALFDSGLTMLEENIISKNVFAAIQIEHQRKLDEIVNRIPENMRPMLNEFAGMEGSYIYRGLEKGDAKYVSYVLQKTPGGSS